MGGVIAKSKAASCYKAKQASKLTCKSASSIVYGQLVRFGDSGSDYSFHVIGNHYRPCFIISLFEIAQRKNKVISEVDFFGQLKNYLLHDADNIADL